MKKISFSFLIVTMLASCAPKPYVVDVTDTKDYYLNCDQLAAAIGRSQQYKTEARAEDKFRFKYIFIPTGVIAMYRFNKAEGNAVKRINHLQQMQTSKGCNAQMVNPQMLQYQNPTDTYGRPSYPNVNRAPEDYVPNEIRGY